MTHSDPHAGTVSGSAPHDALDDARKVTHDAADELKHAARDAAGKATAEVSKTAEKARETAAEEVGSIAAALRTAAGELRGGSLQERTFSQLADGLADASDTMRGKDMGAMLGELNGFARRHPLAFLGGAALLGFAATRVIKASAEGSADVTGPATPAPATSFDDGGAPA